MSISGLCFPVFLGGESNVKFVTGFETKSLVQVLKQKVNNLLYANLLHLFIMFGKHKHIRYIDKINHVWCEIAFHGWGFDCIMISPCNTSNLSGYPSTSTNNVLASEAQHIIGFKCLDIQYGQCLLTPCLIHHRRKIVRSKVCESRYSSKFEQELQL